MRRIVLGILSILAIASASAGAAQLAPTDAQIRKAVARLGPQRGETGSPEFEIFYRSPRRSAEILIASLKPIPRGQYATGKHPQVVWEIRALRSLTGLDFCAPTRANLAEEEAHFLDHDPGNGDVEFFGTWMSRDRVWVAPVDAQSEIIKKWREWFREHGKTFKYVNDRNYDHWYF